ncbi:MAG: 30S ribosomal protein S1 [Treponema sp.]|nr:30S ribosomal protein S1 [Treponema sp.]
MVIAIDGPAGSGKSSIARLLAEGLSGGTTGAWSYLNTGNLYRAVTLDCLERGIDPLDQDKALEAAGAADIQYRSGGVYLNGAYVDNKLHTDEIDRLVSPLSANVPLRYVLNDLIRKIARDQNIVVEGRDVTTVVFPQAEYRFYLDASVETRAQRRFDQGVSDLSLEEIQQSIEERDEQDRNKTEGNLKIVPNVAYFDTSLLTLNEVYERLVEKIMGEGKVMIEREVESNAKFADTNTAEGTVGQSPDVSGDNIQTQMLEESLRSMEMLEDGQLVTGVVIQVTEDHVYIDVGYKSEGQIPLGEFTEPPNIGDTVSVILVSKENKYGGISVSKQKADDKIFMKNLRQAFQDHSSVEGTIEKIVKGGYDVNLGAGLRAFLPISQADTQRVEKAESFLGLKATFYVERLYSDGKLNIVVNRRKYLEEAIESKRNAFFETTEIGAEITGVVKSFTSFGAFIDLGGFDGLLHINDMSWGHVTRPKDFVRKGQEIHLKVVRLEPSEKRINLSLKHFSDDPWVHFEDKYQVNDIIKGKVTKLTEFGAFIELEEGIEGLAHISEFSWVRKVQKPGDLLSIGDEVECMVLGYDLQKGRVSLGLKQVTTNPWANIEERYPMGTRLTRKVVKLTNAGAFIELEEGIDGFLHAEDMSWTRKIKHPESEFGAGQDLEVMVLGIDLEKHSIRLGVKQLEDDPWKTFADTYKPGTQVEGEISSVTDFGVFLKIPGGIEGIIHKSNLPENRDQDPDELLKKYKERVGEKLKAVVLEIQSDKQKAAFSIKDYQKKVQRDELSRYMATGESDDSPFTLGDFLKSKSN